MLRIYLLSKHKTMSGYTSVNGKNLQNSLTVNKIQNNPFLANNNGGNNVFSTMSSTINNSTSPSSSTAATNAPALITSIAGSPGRARDRNNFMQPTNMAPMQLSLLKGYICIAIVGFIFVFVYFFL